MYYAFLEFDACQHSKKKMILLKNISDARSTKKSTLLVGLLLMIGNSSASMLTLSKPFKNKSTQMGVCIRSLNKGNITITDAAHCSRLIPSDIIDNFGYRFLTIFRVLQSPHDITSHSSSRIWSCVEHNLCIYIL